MNISITFPVNDLRKPSGTHFKPSGTSNLLLTFMFVTQKIWDTIGTNLSFSCKETKKLTEKSESLLHE